VGYTPKQTHCKYLGPQYCNVYPGVDGRIILKCIFRKWEWVNLSGLFLLKIGTGKWAVINAIMNLRVP
jgi:hypothetical protein